MHITDSDPIQTLIFILRPNSKKTPYAEMHGQWASKRTTMIDGREHYMCGALPKLSYSNRESLMDKDSTISPSAISLPLQSPPNQIKCNNI